MLGSSVAPEGVAARNGRLDSEAVPAEGPAYHSCPQLFWRICPKAPESPTALEEMAAQLEALGSPTVLPEVVTFGGHTATEVVPRKGPVHCYCPESEAGRTTVGKADESPRNPLVDGRCSATSALFPSGAGLLAAVLPLMVVPSGAAHFVVPPLSAS